MKIKLTLNELTKIIEKVINEQNFEEMSEIESKIKEWNSDPCSGNCVDERLDEANEILDGYGVEVLRGKAWNDRYYGNIIALYVNMGETYEKTIVYDVSKGEFMLTSWGDFMEEWEAENEEPEEDDEMSDMAEIASHWHGGQWSALYSFASTKEIHLPIADYLSEIEEDLSSLDKEENPEEYKELLILKLFFLNQESK